MSDETMAGRMGEGGTVPRQAARGGSSSERRRSPSGDRHGATPQPTRDTHHATRDTPSSLRFGVPSKGRMEEPTLRFLEDAGLPVSRPNPRQYVGHIGGLAGVAAVFQRATDIVAKVDDGNLDLGISGYDAVCEYRYDDDNLIVLLEDLGYSRAQIAVAVPEAWLDVSSIADLADLAVEYKVSGRELRIATPFPNLARAFLHRHGIHYFVLTGAHGALEAAPAMGYADLVIEITETGTTLRDNRLRLLDGGSVLRSQACLIGNRRLLAAEQSKRDLLRGIMELVEARLRARTFRRITANVRGDSPEAVARQVIAQMETAGAQGPTIARVYPKQAPQGDPWFAVTIIVPAALLLRAVDHLRHAGASGISVQTPEYLFEAESWSYRAAMRELQRERDE